MMWAGILVALAGGAIHGVAADAGTPGMSMMNPSQIGLWQAKAKQAKELATLQTLSANTDQLAFAPKAYCFEQPISHFDKSINGTFCQRYWMDASSYKPGGPVFVLDGGETSGANRIPYLEKGILQILSNATNGLSIVLEHRYYGESTPAKDLSTDELRFLNNAEALEDSAQFVLNFKPPKELLSLNDEMALHPNNTPWIYYGGSYAGARAAHMRVKYPEIVWGAIASSAVTHAQISMPEYYDPIMKYGPPECISALQDAISTVDFILKMPKPVTDKFKGLFGLQGLEDDDFASALSTPLGSWQGKNWDPEVGSNEFDHFCETLLEGKAGSKIGLVKVPAEVMNFAKYIKENVATQCPEDSSIEDCFGSHDDSKFQDTSLNQEWKLWTFQVCTQWGYFQHAPLEGPTIVSRHVTLEYTSKICKQAFPPGKFFSVPEWPDVEEVNSRGDYGIEFDRLAFIDGDRDPWRTMTPQSDVAPPRKSSVNKPTAIIFDGVHHFDENGLLDHTKEPARIRDVHAFEVNFIQEWVAKFNEEKKKVYGSY